MKYIYEVIEDEYFDYWKETFQKEFFIKWKAEYNVSRFIQQEVEKNIQQVSLEYGLLSQIVKINRELVVVAKKSSREKQNDMNERKDKSSTKKYITKGKQYDSKRKMINFEF